MSCIKNIALSEPLVEVVPKKRVISNINTFLDLDLYKVKVSDLDFAHKYQLHLTATDNVDALACWFEADFSKLKNPIKLSTSPFSRPTHWRQTIFYLAEPIKGILGKTLTGSIAVRKSAANPRDLDIKYSFHYEDEVSNVNYKQMYKLQ